jgi:hypothetical protein
MGDRMLIDIIDYIKRLEQERYRALIIHTIPMRSPILTAFSQKFCEHLGGKYLDLLDFFIQSPQLSETIDRFSPEKFRELLIQQSRSYALLVVDRIDFLIDTWRKTERQDFYRLVQNQWDSYKEGMKATLVLCLQTSQEIEALKIHNSQGMSRIMCLTDFMDFA